MHLHHVIISYVSYRARGWALELFFIYYWAAYARTLSLTLRLFPTKKYVKGGLFVYAAHVHNTRV